MTGKGKNIQQLGTGSIRGNLQVNVGTSGISIEGNGNLIIDSLEQKRKLAEAATEIQQLLKQLEQSYPVGTTSQNMLLAAEVIRQIDNNPSTHQRVLTALKAGGAEAFKQALNHPIANFLIGALQD